MFTYVKNNTIIHNGREILVNRKIKNHSWTRHRPFLVFFNALMSQFLSVSGENIRSKFLYRQNVNAKYMLIKIVFLIISKTLMYIL